MNTCDVTIVIVNYNTRDLILDCLRSIHEQTHGLAFEVIVVDNASADRSAAAILESFPQVRLIANSQNRGFAAANNQGIRIARGRYVLLLNPDTVVLDHALEKTVAFADRHPDMGVVGCQVLENETKIQPTCFAFPSPLNLLLVGTGLSHLLPHSRLFARHNLGNWKRDTERDVDVVSGMFMLVRRQAIDEVGLMDEAYFVYAEETDWCFRFHRAGWRCVFAPVAQIIHRDGGGKSTAQVGVRMYVQLQKSLLIFFRKNRGWPAFAAAKLIYVFAMAFRAAAWRTCRWLGLGQNPDLRWRQSHAALAYHLLGKEPQT